jgi:Pyruvate/2-oxoacid:ferredoxin oxidoreductase delta subunit
VSLHHPKDGKLEEVGRVQLFFQTLYARWEIPILRVLDVTTRFFVKIKAKPVLWVLSRILGAFLPTAEVATHKQALAFIDSISGLENTQIAVGPCMCQKALRKKKGTYMKDMVVLSGSEAYKRAYGSEYKDLTPEEAKTLLGELHDEGLIPTFFSCMSSKGWLYAICNCDSEICFPFRAHAAAGAVMFPGAEIVAQEKNKCTGCAECVKRCLFGAISMNETGKAETEYAKCYGCGLCVATCKSEARRMVKRENYKNRYYPIEWVTHSAGH